MLSDAIRVIYVELSKLQGIMKKSIKDMSNLDKWALFFQYASNPKYRENLKKVIDSKEALQMEGNLLMSIRQDEHGRAVFRSRRIYESDLASNLATAEDRGKKETAKKMLSIGLPISQITLVTGLTEKLRANNPVSIRGCLKSETNFRFQTAPNCYFLSATLIRFSARFSFISARR